MSLADAARADEPLIGERRLCESLARQWDRFASGGPLCPPGCLCIRGVMIEVTPQEVEGDILAFLAARFPATERKALADLLARRDLERAWGSVGFGDWIRALPDAGLDKTDFADLTDSLGRAIESLGGPDPAPPPRFTCT